MVRRNPIEWKEANMCFRPDERHEHVFSGETKKKIAYINLWHGRERNRFVFIKWNRLFFSTHQPTMHTYFFSWEFFYQTFDSNHQFCVRIFGINYVLDTKCQRSLPIIILLSLTSLLNSNLKFENEINDFISTWDFIKENKNTKNRKKQQTTANKFLICIYP